MFFLLVLMSANAACETHHQIKEITVKRSKLAIKFYKIVVDLQEFVVIKALFETIPRIIFPNFCSQLNTI